jgi:AcrR family transcriptional regulator
MTENLIVPEPNTPTRSDAIRNRTLILDTARRLFAEQGVNAVPMSAIADAAGIGKGTLYRNFENKTQLCHALLDDDDRDMQDRTLQRLRTVLDPLDNLRWFMTERLHFIDRNEPLLCASDPSAGEPLEHTANWWCRQTIRGLIGQIDPPGDLDYFTDVLYVMLDVRVVGFQKRTLDYTTERIIEGLMTAIDRLVG